MGGYNKEDQLVSKNPDIALEHTLKYWQKNRFDFPIYLVTYTSDRPTYISKNIGTDTQPYTGIPLYVRVPLLFKLVCLYYYTTGDYSREDQIVSVSEKN